MVHNLHIVVADLADGTVKPLYVGVDSTKASQIFLEADKSHEAVRLFPFPVAMQVRYPADEALQIAAQNKLNADREDTELTRKRAALTIANRKAKESADEAKQLTAEIAEIAANKKVKEATAEAKQSSADLSKLKTK